MLIERSSPKFSAYAASAVILKELILIHILLHSIQLQLYYNGPDISLVWPTLCKNIETVWSVLYHSLVILIMISTSFSNSFIFHLFCDTRRGRQLLAIWLHACRGRQGWYSYISQNRTISQNFLGVNYITEYSFVHLICCCCSCVVSIVILYSYACLHA